MNKINVEEQLDYAIIEHGAIRHLEEYEARKRRGRILIVRLGSYAAAACVLLAAFVGGKESYDARVAGRSVTFDDYLRSGSAVTALLNDGENKEALKLIKELRLLTEEETASEDEWAAYEKEELDYLEAVCLLRQGRFISARKALKTIVKQDGYFSAKAEQLLKKL